MRKDDIDENGTTYILVDPHNEKTDKYSPRPYAKLMTELLRYLSSEIQTVAIKSGASHKLGIGDNRGASLGLAAETSK